MVRGLHLGGEGAGLLVVAHHPQVGRGEHRGAGSKVGCSRVGPPSIRSEAESPSAEGGEEGATGWAPTGGRNGGPDGRLGRVVEGSVDEVKVGPATVASSLGTSGVSSAAPERHATSGSSSEVELRKVVVGPVLGRR